MARIKYYYNTKTCKYEKAKVKNSDVIFNLLGFLVFTSILALGLAIAYSSLYMSPEEVALKKENVALQKHYQILENRVEEVDQIIAALEARDDQIYRKIYEVEPLPNTIREAGTGGKDLYESILERGFRDRSIVRGLHEKINKIKAKAHIQNQSYNELIASNLESPTFIPSIQPVQNDEINKLASGYGMRIHPIHKGRYMHNGLDYAAQRGTPVYATADGVIKLTKESDELTGYGNQIEVDHQNGFITKYAHLEEIKVKKGEVVKRGEIIGTVGNSGGSIAPHLHYEVISDGERVNPIHFILLGLDEHQYHQLLRLSARENQSFD